MRSALTPASSRSRGETSAAISPIFVVEAAVKSGALITAGKALEHGRPVLAVPGDIDRETSHGCNLLIRDGAVPVLGVDDMLETVVDPLQCRHS